MLGITIDFYILARLTSQNAPVIFHHMKKYY